MYGMKECSTSVKKWGIFEVTLSGPEEGNPFKDQKLQAVFTGRKESVVAEGFYDGEGIYKVRFMPSFTGNYGFVLNASFLSSPISGKFFVEEADENVHGPVHTSNTYHFAYADGTPYVPVGTTCYVWNLKSEEEIEETLASLRTSGFNKIRFCVFPKHYIYNLKDPSSFPYPGTPMDCSVLTEENFFDYTQKKEGNHFSHERFNPEHFRKIEYCITELSKSGIEADIILFHPYDRWGFATMSEAENDFYLNYVVNRFAAYRNVWWAMANEWDLLSTKTVKDWEHLAETLVNKDPYNHLRSIHNCREIYDHTRAWITHVSMQRVDLYKCAELTDTYRTRYQKPVVMDEIGYEGEMPLGWGNLTSEEMTRRFWETAIRGGYPQHSEAYLSDPDHIWWAHGGKLQGESWKRAAFLRKILEEVPGNGLMPLMDEWDSVSAVPESEWSLSVKSQYIYYYSFMRPSYRDFKLNNNTDYAVEVIDTYNMTIDLYGIVHGAFRVELPKKQYMAIRLRKAEEADYERINAAKEEVTELIEIVQEPVVEETIIMPVVNEPIEEEEPIVIRPVVIEPEEKEEMIDETLVFEPIVISDDTEVLEAIDEDIMIEELPIEEPVEGMPSDLPDVEEEEEELDLETMLQRRHLHTSDDDEVFEASPINSVYYEDGVEKTTMLNLSEVPELHDEPSIMRPLGEVDTDELKGTFESIFDLKDNNPIDGSADTLRIPPINFGRSINNGPKNK